MYWWNIKELKATLASGTLSEHARFLYLLIYSVVGALVSEFPLIAENPNIWDRVSSATVILATISGTTLAYRMNGGKNGHHFLERYLAIGWVFLLRFAAFIIPIMVVAYIFASTIGLVGEFSTAFDAVLIFVFMVFYYFGLCKHIQGVAAIERSAVPN